MRRSIQLGNDAWKDIAPVSRVRLYVADHVYFNTQPDTFIAYTLEDTIELCEACQFNARNRLCYLRRQETMGDFSSGQNVLHHQTRAERICKGQQESDVTANADVIAEKARKEVFDNRPAFVQATGNTAAERMLFRPHDKPGSARAQMEQDPACTASMP